MILLLPHPPPHGNRLDRRHRGRLRKRKNLLKMERRGDGGGRVWGRSQIIGLRESLALYKSFNALWF
jgi:hypothetical protein